MKIDYIIKQVYLKVKKTMKTDIKGACLSEEDITCFLDHKLGDKDKSRILDHIISCGKCAEAVKENYALENVLNDTTIPEPPFSLAEKAKNLFPYNAKVNVLDIVLEIKEKIIDIVNTTGQVIKSYQQPTFAPALVFRGMNKSKEANEIRIAKKFNNVTVNIEIEKQKAKLVDISIYTTDSKSRERMNGVRVNLIKKDREIESILTERGKARFEKIKPDSYKVMITSEGKQIGVINISMRAEK